MSGVSEETAGSSPEQPWRVRGVIVNVVYESGGGGLTREEILKRVRRRWPATGSIDHHIDSLLRLGVLTVGEEPDTRRIRATEDALEYLRG